MTQEELKLGYTYKAGFLYRKSDGKRIDNIVPRTESISYYTYVRSVDGKRKSTYAHRMIYVYHNGAIPKGLVIDHIDGNGLNNNIENLQAITHSDNLLKSKIEKTNVTGHKNIAYDKNTKKKYRAYKMVDGKRKYATRASTLAEAILLQKSL